MFLPQMSLVAFSVLSRSLAVPCPPSHLSSFLLQIGLGLQRILCVVVHLSGCCVSPSRYRSAQDYQVKMGNSETTFTLRRALAEAHA